MSWTNVKSKYINIIGTSSVQVVTTPNRLRALWIHADSSGTMTCYDASAANSSASTMIIALPNAQGGTDATQSLLLPSAGIRHETALFVTVSTSGTARITFFYD